MSAASHGARARTALLILGAAAFAGGAEAQAQSRSSRVERDGAPRAARGVREAVERIPAAPADPLAALGISAATSGGARDTLGLLISTVTPDGPADRAGVDAGSRLAEINGVSLRTAAGEDASADAIGRRVAKALVASTSSGEVALRLYRGGHFRVVTVTPPASARPAAAEPRLTLAPAPAAVPVAPVAAAIAVPVPHADASTSVAAPTTAVAPAASASASSLAAVIDATVQTQVQLGRLVSQEEATDGPMLDSLAAVQVELRALQRRLRAMQARNAARTPAPHAAAAGATTDADVPLDGLKVGAVADELVAYYGEGSDAGLLVLQADAAWAPLRSGDVILKVNDAAVTPAALHTAQAAGGKLDVLRRRRMVTVTLPPRE